MSRSTVELDTDVRDLTERIAARLGKSFSATVQDGLLYIAAHFNWAVQVDPGEEFDDGQREELFVLWRGLPPEKRAHILALLESAEKFDTELELRESLEHVDKELQQARSSLELHQQTAAAREARIHELERSLNMALSERGSSTYRPCFPLRTDEWEVTLTASLPVVPSANVWIVDFSPPYYLIATRRARVELEP